MSRKPRREGTLNEYIKNISVRIRRVHSAMLFWRANAGTSANDDPAFAPSLLLATFDNLRAYAVSFQTANNEYAAFQTSIEEHLRLKGSPNFAMQHGGLLLIYKDGLIRISLTPEDQMPADERLADSDFYMNRVPGVFLPAFGRKENLN